VGKLDGVVSPVLSNRRWWLSTAVLHCSAKRRTMVFCVLPRTADQAEDLAVGQA
jgi:hypothetical protein